MQHIIAIALFNSLEGELYTEILVFQNKETFLRGVIAFLYNHYTGEDYASSLEVIKNSKEIVEENMKSEDDHSILIATYLLAEYRKYLTLPFNSINIDRFVNKLFNILDNYEIKPDFKYIQID